MKATKMMFPVPTPCLYHGSMTEYHGEGFVQGPFDYGMGGGRYQITFAEREAISTPNRDSFTVNETE